MTVVYVAQIISLVHRQTSICLHNSAIIAETPTRPIIRAEANNDVTRFFLLIHICVRRRLS